MAIISYEDITTLRKNHPHKKIVFCSGSFDLTHAGHVLFFEDCKKLGDILVVLIGGDKLLRRYKGDLRPILNQDIRAKTVDSYKPVDYTVIEQDFEDKAYWLHGVERTLKMLKPDVYVVNDDARDLEFRRKLCSELKIELAVLQRHCPKEFDHISTSNIISKILQLKEEKH